MADQRWHDAERRELENLDYFLEHLARAIDRGEVPYESYERLAPRYLERREELLGIVFPQESVSTWHPASPIVSAEPKAPAATIAADEGGPALDLTWGAGRSQAEAQAEWDAQSRATAPRLVELSQTPAQALPWTTVLLFAGAFLVIVATAIFAFWAWDRVGPGVKLAGLGTVTLGFYAAGWFTRWRLGLRTGGAALTVVASAMLLFDWWILIDGYHLPAVGSWSIALLVTAGVYWLCEVALGDRFYGVAGAAAQVGWWWLMVQGLHLGSSWRYAGIGVIALLWLFAAERGRDTETFGSLSQILEWAAPVAAVFAAIGVASASVLGLTGSLALSGCAAVVSWSGAVIATRTRLLDERFRAVCGGLLQIPLLLSLVLPGQPTWVTVGLLAVVAAGYALYALWRGGAAFAIPGFAVELIALLGAMHLLHLGDHAKTALVGALAVTWVAAGALAERFADRPQLESFESAPGFSRAGLGSGLVLMVAASIATPSVGVGVPLTGVLTPAADVQLAAILLAEWAAVSLLKRDPAFAIPTVTWSFWSLAALLAWWQPSAHSAIYALALVALAAIWLAVREPMKRFYSLNAAGFGLVMRGMALLIVFGGLLAESYFFELSSWQSVGLVGFAALVFMADAFIAGPGVSAAIASSLIVLAAYLAADRSNVTHVATALAVSASSLALATLGFVLRNARALQAKSLAIGGCGMALLVAPFAIESMWPAVVSVLVWTLAVVVAGFVARDQRYAAGAGLGITVATLLVLDITDPLSGVSVAVLGVLAVLLGLPSVTRWAGREGEGRTIGALLAGWGAGAMLIYLWMAWSEVLLPGQSPHWVHLTTHGAAIACLVLGAYVAAQSVFWRTELLGYLGGAVILAAAVLELQANSLNTTEYYTTAVAIYAITSGYLYAWYHPERGVPAGIDAVAVVVGLGVPGLLSLAAFADPVTHMGWAVALSVVAVAAGAALKVRWYFFGGITTIVISTGYRALVYLAGLWWVILGMLGIAAIVVALAWQRQRDVLTEAFDSVQGWKR